MGGLFSFSKRRQPGRYNTHYYKITTARPGLFLSMRMLSCSCFPYPLSSPRRETLLRQSLHLLCWKKKTVSKPLSSVQSFTHTVLCQQPNFHPKTILILNTFQQGSIQLYSLLGKYYSFTLLIKCFKRTRQEN